MPVSLRQRLICQRWGTMVEGAIVIPILLMVTLLIIQFGMLAYANQMAEEAARYGARVGSVTQKNPAGAAAAAAGSFASSAFGAGSPNVSVLAPGGVAGSTLKVRVEYQVPNIAGAFLPVGSLTASGEATTRQEGW